MNPSPAVFTSFLLFAALGPDQVSPHGYLTQPLAKFIGPGVDISQYSATIDSKALFPDGEFNTDYTINVQSFVENYENSEYKSIKALIEDNQVLVSPQATASCGFTAPEQTSYGAVNDTVYWGRNSDITLDEGLVHAGPCETWCDGNQAQQNMDCQAAHAPASGKGSSPIPIDVSACQNAKRLTFYWIAMHGATWQVYINCVNINGGTGGADSTSPTETGTATTTSRDTPANTPVNPSTPNNSPPTTTENVAPASAPTPVREPERENTNDPSGKPKCSRRRIRS